MTTVLTPPKLLTAEEYLHRPDDGKRTELVKGVVVERSLPSPRHGEVCVNSSYLLRRFLEDSPLGRRARPVRGAAGIPRGVAAVF